MTPTMGPVHNIITFGAIGIDRIIAEAQVTRATLYRHFAGKEDLVLAYLDASDRAVRTVTDDAVADGLSASDTLRAIGMSIAQSIRSPGFRGCAFLNAANEYPDTRHPVHQAVVAHRQWFLDTVTDLLARIHETRAEPAAQHFVMLRDGAMVSGCLADPVPVIDTLLRGVEGLLRAHVAPATAD